MDYSLPGSSVHEISQARILEWVAISFSRRYSRPRDRTCASCIGRWILNHWATREVTTLKKKMFIILQLAINNNICCSVFKLGPTVCDPMDCSVPGFPVLHFLLEFAQTHVHWISDAIQPSHPLSSSFVFNLSQHQSLFQWNQLFISSGQSIGASTSAFPMNIQGWFPLGWTGLSSVQSKGLSKVFSTLMTSSELDHTYFQLRSYGLGLDLIWGSSF